MPSFDDISHTPLPQLAPRSHDSHKGDYGRALLIGGSRGMSGAIALAGRATLRSGAGLVTLAVPAISAGCCRGRRAIVHDARIDRQRRASRNVGGRRRAGDFNGVDGRCDRTGTWP